MMFALSPGILVAAFPAAGRGRALGLSATLTYLGMSIGPGLGGFLTQHFGWPAIFLINVPIGFGMWLLAARTLRPERPPGSQPFDPAGAITLAIGLAALLLALSKGGDLGWGHPWIRVMAGTGVAALAGFVIIERRLAHPALDLGLFASRRFSASMAAAGLCYLCFAALQFLMPFFLLHGAGLAPARAGLYMMAVPLGMMSVSAASGHLSDKVGVTLPATAGMLLVAAGLGSLGWIAPAWPPRWIVAALAMAGVGAGLFTAPNNSAIMGAAPGNRQGVAGALLAAARTVGFAAGVALAGLIYAAALRNAADVTPAVVTWGVQQGLRVTAVAALLGAACSLLRGAPRTLPEQ
jgi:MFS family permease